MTREELKAHCLRQIENCEMWARLKGEEPYGKVYEEHELILELLEQEPILDKIREVVDKWQSDIWADTLAYEYMVKIAELVELQAESEE